MSCGLEFFLLLFFFKKDKKLQVHMPGEHISEGNAGLQQAGRRFDFFITVLNTINVASPASLHPESVQ